MKKTVILLFFLSPLLTCCEKEDLAIIRPLDDARNIVDLSDIIRSVDLLRLEDGPKSMLTYPNKVLLLPDGGIIIKDSGGKIHKFNADGTYACKIGDKGRGPGEYVKLQDICHEKGTGHISVLDIGRILRYDVSSGAFVNEIAIPRHNYDELCSDGKGGFWLFAAAPDYDQYNFNETFNTLYHIPAGGGDPDRKIIPRKDYIMNVALMSQASDGNTFLKPLEGENILYAISESVKPVARFDMGEKAAPNHFMINNGFPDFARYMPSDYFKNYLYVHDSSDHLYFAVIGPKADTYHFVFNKNTGKGIQWKDLYDTDTPTIIMASDKEFFYVMVFSAPELLKLSPEKLSPLNREIVKTIKEKNFELNSNPLIAKVKYLI